MKVKMTKEIRTDKKGRKTEVMLFENGKNCKSREVKRGYLNSKEMNNFFTLISLEEMLLGKRGFDITADRKPMAEAWEERGIITKDQRKNLKMATTYLTKFLESVFDDNLDVKTKDIIMKKRVKFDFRLIDDYTVTKLGNMFNTKKDYQVSSDELYDLVEAKMEICCKNCTKDGSCCEVRDFYERYIIPPMDGETDLPNCEYAYKK